MQRLRALGRVDGRPGAGLGAAGAEGRERESGERATGARPPARIRVRPIPARPIDVILYDYSHGAGSFQAPAPIPRRHRRDTATGGTPSTDWPTMSR